MLHIVFSGPSPFPSLPTRRFPGGGTIAGIPQSRRMEGGPTSASLVNSPGVVRRYHRWQTLTINSVGYIGARAHRERIYKESVSVSGATTEDAWPGHPCIWSRRVGDRLSASKLLKHKALESDAKERFVFLMPHTIPSSYASNAWMPMHDARSLKWQTISRRRCRHPLHKFSTKTPFRIRNQRNP